MNDRATMQDIQDLKAQIAALKADLIKWDVALKCGLLEAITS